MMGNVLVSFVRMMPPRTAMVEGGRKTVVCSCRGMGREASGFHDELLLGRERVVVTNERRTKKNGVILYIVRSKKR